MSIWEWLGIEPTTDVAVIKKAYSEAAKKYHPSEHPEEFKILRECYKFAIAYAENSQDNAHDDEQMTTGNYFEEVKKTSNEINFSFDISKKNLDTEDTEKPSYDFSEVSCEVSLSDRQSRMLNFFEKIMIHIQKNPSNYGYNGLIETVMWNWDLSPYKEEITPLFIDHLIDILDKNPVLGNDTLSEIESRLFKNVSDPRLGVIYSKFRSLYQDWYDSSNKNHVFKVDVEMWFCGGVVYPKVSSNEYITFGKPVKKGKDNYFVLADDVLLFGKTYSLKYLFWEELSYKVNPVSDKLTIYAPDNTMLLEVKTGALEYMHFLDRLVTNKSRYIGKKVMDSSGFMSNLDKYSRTFARFTEKLKAMLVWVSFLLVGGFIFWLGLEYDALFLEKHLIIKLVWVLFVIAFGLGSILFFVMLIARSLELLEISSIVGISIKHIKEFRKDIKDGKAEYVLGNQIFLFKKYIIYSVGGNYQILSLDSIRETQCVRAIPGEKSASLRMVLRSESVLYCDMYSETAIREVMTKILMRQLEDRETWS
ncbi:MAG: hypothetical protein VZR24_09400 [Butyrivibrio hungatei]|nr:hypothetical protein [Butyrivibrio hungatei]